MLKSTATLLALHGANPFQVKHYNNAALFLERIDQDLCSLTLEELSRIEGMGKSTAALIHEINTTGTLQRWGGLMAATPQGVLSMLELRGIGPKKVRALWKDLGIECIEDLLQACESGKVAQLPGFGQKTQEAIQESQAWRVRYHGKFHYATALPYATALESDLKQAFPGLLISVVGAFRRKIEVIEQVAFLIGTTDIEVVKDWLNHSSAIQQEVKLSAPFAWRGRFVESNLKLTILFCSQGSFYKDLILQTGAEKHLAQPIQEEGKSIGELVAKVPTWSSEAEAYKQAKLPYIPPELREGLVELAWAQAGAPQLLETSDLKGTLHNHTTHSDGQHSLEAMARYCMKLGYEYIGITDHSQSAAYAGGLNDEAVRQQHQVIDRLNQELAPFKVFKGIESDILPDGSLDYPDEILASFDFILASVHTGLNMDQQKATERLIKAISNPFTTILGHLTGRLLLRREGYPIDHKAVIDACAAHGVIIEINANPWRLELDWRWVQYAIQQNVWLSINPDAHDKEGINNMYHGVCVGRKGGLTKQHTFNALSREAVEQHFQSRRATALRSVQA